MHHFKFSSNAGDVYNFNESLGILREDMPQIAPHLIGHFHIWLRDVGVMSVFRKTAVSELKPTQCEFNVQRVHKKLADIKVDGWVAISKTIIISNDNYVLDGHNTMVAILQSDNISEVTVPTLRVKLPMKELLGLIRQQYPFVYYKSVNNVN